MKNYFAKRHFESKLDGGLITGNVGLSARKVDEDDDFLAIA